MAWRERISVNPSICHGRPCIAGTRVLASAVIDNVAAGISHDEILKSYPTITADDIRAALEYAAELARERTVFLPKGAA